MSNANTLNWTMYDVRNMTSVPDTDKSMLHNQFIRSETNADCADMVLAMAYVKRQKWGELYEGEVGLDRGTLFPDLDLPFMGKGDCPHDE